MCYYCKQDGFKNKKAVKNHYKKCEKAIKEEKRSIRVVKQKNFGKKKSKKQATPKTKQKKRRSRKKQV